MLLHMIILIIKHFKKHLYNLDIKISICYIIQFIIQKIDMAMRIFFSFTLYQKSISINII